MLALLLVGILLQAKQTGSAVCTNCTQSQVCSATCQYNCNPCEQNQYCFAAGGGSNLCLACNTACDGCYSAGPSQCVRCKPGYSRTLGVSCSVCETGSFGIDCNQTCHCGVPESCNVTNGHCKGKCEKGYYIPPECQTECPDGKYGVDCINDCHCVNDSVCDKILGQCPGLTCHPEWTGPGCSLRLPKLAQPPEVVSATCSQVKVMWHAWNSNTDFGDPVLPLHQYRLYSTIDPSDQQAWKQETTVAYDPNASRHEYTVTNPQRDKFYVFRVDIYYTDDGKVEKTHAEGFPSDPPAFVPCTVTTSPPPVTVPIIVGSDIFDTMTTAVQSNGSLLVTWSVDPQLTKFKWNISLVYELVGTGDCQSNSGSTPTVVHLDDSVNQYLIPQPPLLSWSRYNISLTAQGTGSVSTTNGNEQRTAITSEVAPSGNVSTLQVREEDVSSDAFTLWWSPPACDQRGGTLLRYDVLVIRADDARNIQTFVSNTTTFRVETNIRPFTRYNVSVRYVNNVGQGPYSPVYSLVTKAAVPEAVQITDITPDSYSLLVNFSLLDDGRGVIREYYVQYSQGSDKFPQPQSLALNASTLVLPAILTGLRAQTLYYVRVRAETEAGYGPYGQTRSAQTLLTSPTAPSSASTGQINQTCITVNWGPPDQSLIPVVEYVVTVKKVSGNETYSKILPSNATSHTQCQLDPGTLYQVSVSSRSSSASSRPVSLQATTTLLQPPNPPPPVLVSVGNDSATVRINPVNNFAGTVSAYQIKVQTLGTSRNKRQTSSIPGYVTAQLAAGEVAMERDFVIGDGQKYGSYDNKALEPGTRYAVHYLVISSAGGQSTVSNSTMADEVFIPVPTLPPVVVTTKSTNATVTTPVPLPPPAEDEDNSAVLIGIILALIFVIILIILIIVLIVWWRRCQSRLLKPPYLELDEGTKPKSPPPPVEVYDPEKYWNQITSLRESRYIVVGRECLPGNPLIPVGAHPGLDKNAPKLSFNKEFRSLPHTFDQATTSVAQQFPDRNRFPHILPYDHSLVELAPDSSSRCTYVNANFVSGYKRPRCYIAAQSPYDTQSAVDFWRLIRQQSVKTVVMVANVVEDNIVKCTQFWPEEDDKVSIGDFFLERREQAEYADFIVRDVHVREGGEQYGHTVRLFEFTSWPEHGVPDDPIPFLDMRYKVRQYHADDMSPILVHCGTGVGRTAVFIAVDSLIQQYARDGLISVFTWVRKMRKERPLMVRTFKQYVFIYECILEEFHAGQTMTDITTIKPMYHQWTTKNSKTGHTYLRDQFQLLYRLTRGPSAAECQAAQKEENVKRNRYPDLLPSDKHRPKLHTHATLSNTDYINAIFVDGYRKRNQFIITQSPMPTTLIDFWRMIYDYKVTTVVMMDNYRQADNTCAEYWPTDVVMKQWEPFFIETTAAFQQENVTIRNLKMVNTQRPHKPHLLRQFQFNAWAQHSFTPVSKTMALDLLDMVMEHHEASADQTPSPIVVHCEDGATHSGLFVALALLCERMEEEQEVDVYHVVKHLKRRRPQIVNDYDQFRFCYKSLWDYLNLRMPGGTFTDTLGQTRNDRTYGPASLSLTSFQDSLY